MQKNTIRKVIARKSYLKKKEEENIDAITPKKSSLNQVMNPIKKESKDIAEDIMPRNSLKKLRNANTERKSIARKPKSSLKKKEEENIDATTPRNFS